MSELWTEYNDEGQPARKIEVFTPVVDDDGFVLSVRLSDQASYTCSSFPHPLVTIDFNGDGDIIAVTFVGPVRRALADALGVPSEASTGDSKPD